jgi:hypothetical protein
MGFCGHSVCSRLCLGHYGASYYARADEIATRGENDREPCFRYRADLERDRLFSRASRRVGLALNKPRKRNPARLNVDVYAFR